MRGKQRNAKLTRAWSSNFAMKNAPANRWHAIRRKWVARVFSNNRPERRGQATKALPWGIRA